jgi:hypothetical protein
MVLSPKPGTIKALYTSDVEEIEKVIKGDKRKKYRINFKSKGRR